MADVPSAGESGCASSAYPMRHCRPTIEARGCIIKTIIIDHWRENGGRIPAVGGITGYVLVLVAGYGSFDFGLPFSVTGDPAGAMQKVERLARNSHSGVDFGCGGRARRAGT